MLILANIISLIANACFTTSSLFKNKKIILTLQSITHILSSIAEFMLKAFSSIPMEVVSLIRDFILLFIKETKQNLKLIISIVCIVIQIVLGIIINIKFCDNAWYGYLPVFGTFLYSIFLVWGYLLKDKTRTELIIKIGLIFNSIAWASYGIFVKLYPATIFNSITLVLCIVAIVKLSKKIKEEKLEKNEEIEQM